MTCKLQECTECRGGALERCDKCWGTGEICSTHDRTWLLCAEEWKRKAELWDELGRELMDVHHLGFRAHNACHVAPLLGRGGQHAAFELLHHLLSLKKAREKADAAQSNEASP